MICLTGIGKDSIRRLCEVSSRFRGARSMDRLDFLIRSLNRPSDKVLVGRIQRHKEFMGQTLMKASECKKRRARDDDDDDDEVESSDDEEDDFTDAPGLNLASEDSGIIWLNMKIEDNEVAGFAPHMHQIIELLKVGSRAQNVSKRNLGTHKKAKKHEETKMR